MVKIFFALAVASLALAGCQSVEDNYGYSKAYQAAFINCRVVDTMEINGQDTTNYRAKLLEVGVDCDVEGLFVKKEV